jgi:hypothetical protein
MIMLIRIHRKVPAIFSVANGNRRQQMKVSPVPGLLIPLESVAAFCGEDLGGPIHADGLEVPADQFEDRMAIDVGEGRYFLRMGDVCEGVAAQDREGALTKGECVGVLKESVCEELAL